MSSFSSVYPAVSRLTLAARRLPPHLHPSRSPSPRHLPLPTRVINEAKEAEVAVDVAAERSEADKIVDGMDFGELSNEFECISSPSVEATARQLARC